MIVRLIVSTAGMVVVMAAMLALGARTIVWPGAWAFLAIMAASSVGIGLWLSRRDPALFAARLAPPIQQAQSPWDRLFMALVLVGTCAWLVFMGFDWRVSGRGSHAFWQILGALLILACLAISVLTFRANSYAAPVVKLQAGQRLADRGPYRFVRHPMYAGGLLFFLGVPLLLGAWRGLLVAPLAAVLLGARAVGEERLLMSGLPGYGDYVRRVRYRLAPLVW